MPVQHSPAKSRDGDTRDDAENEQPPGIDDDSEKQRRSELKSLRRQRTIQCKAMRKILEQFQEINTDNPRFPQDSVPEVVTRDITQYVASILEFNARICSLIDDEAEWEREEPTSLKIAEEVVRAQSSLQCANQRLQERDPSTIIRRSASISDQQPTTQMNPPSSPIVDTSNQHLHGTTVASHLSTSGALNGEETQATPTSVPTNTQTCSALINKLTREYDMTPRKFAGDRLQFRTFLAEFQEYVGRRTDVSGLRKLLILKKFLEREPLIIVEALELTDSNYGVALSLLEKNYSRVDSEKNKVIGELRRLPSVLRPFDYAAINRLVTAVQSHISVLAVNGVTLSEIALTLLDSMETALPPRLRQDFLEQQQADEKYQRRALSSGGTFEPVQPPALSAGNSAAREVEALIDFLRQRLRDMERIKQDNNPTPSTDKKNPEIIRREVSGQKKHHPSTVAAASNLRRESKRILKSRQCLFCKSNEHSSSRCTASLSVQQKREILRKLDRCDKCFRARHPDPGSCEGPRVECSKCKSRLHYTAMHEDSPTTEAIVSAMVSANVGLTNTLLWIACAYVMSGRRRIPIRVFVDPGSSLTVAAPSLCRKIQEPPIGKGDLAIQAFVGSHKRTKVPVRSLRLCGPHGEAELVIQAYEHEIVVDPSNLAPPHVIEAIRGFDRRFPLADPSYLGRWETGPPEILLGLDQAHRLMIDSKPEVIVGEIRGHLSHFGYIIGGPVVDLPRKLDSEPKPAELVCCSATAAHRSAALTESSEAVRNLWTMESIGVTDSTISPSMSADEESAMHQVQTSLTFVNDRYTVSIPKRSSISSLPNNYNNAARRLEHKLIQLERNPTRYRRYHEELMKFVKKGFADEILDPASSVTTSCDGSYYMPHREVVTAFNGSEKWRIVFDCSAKSKGTTSLNDHLLVGPNLNPDLVTLLLNFRLHRVAVSADITCAYMQIAVTEEDQRLFRFLWRFPNESENRTFQMQRVTWGATSSGFILAAVLREHLKRQGSGAELRFGPRFYADDFLASYPDQDSAVAATSELRSILGGAGMQLAKWKSNSEDLLKQLTSTGVQEEHLDAGRDGIFRVLGLAWSASDDVFRFALPNLSKRIPCDRTVSKREALSIVASLYDPLGWLGPFGLRGKRLIQKIWSLNLDWNQQIPTESQLELAAWASEMRQFDRFQIPRQYFRSNLKPASRCLHMFGDASPAAFAAVAYLEKKYSSGLSDCSLIMCRSRLAPLSTMTLPRLELMAALLAVRLKKFLVERMEVEFDEVRFYTDSMIAYFWITCENPGRCKQFVYNRVQEIRANSQCSQWRHLAGEANVSDYATRGISAAELTGCDEWWNGPAWIGLPDDQKPTSQPRAIPTEAMEIARTELRKIVAPVLPTSCVVDLGRFRSLAGAVRVVRYVLQFIARCRRQTDVALRSLFRAAEVKLIRWTQMEHFPEERALTRLGERVSTTSKLAGFSLFIDSDDLLRAKTRLSQGTLLSYDEKNPIVLPGDSRLAKLYILDTHRTNAHFGVSTILSTLRRRFWITRGRQVIKSLLLRCVVCRKSQGRPAAQIEAPLPAHRVDLQFPFSTAAVDFAGPFFTKHRQDCVKTYLAVFSCCTTRAVHLEAVPSMSAPQTGLALRRFLAVYPSCQRFVSDNGRSFVRAATDLKRLFNSFGDRETRDVLQGRLIDWQFNVPRAPWRGGVFERMVGIVKSAMYKTLGKSLVGYEEFRTILTELTAVINSRPLSYVTGDGDSPSPITPAHFLQGGPPRVPLAGIAPIDKIFSDECASAEELRKGVKHRTTYFKNLCSRWFREYLLLLRNANLTSGQIQQAIPVGEVCLLKDDSVPRVKWHLVRVKEHHPGRDGLVRSYTITLPNGKTTRRAAQVLYPLEIGSAESSSTSTATELTNNSSPPPTS